MRKNVMLLIGYLTNGGAERSIINVANELKKYHNVVLVCCNNKRRDYECNVPIIEIPELKFRKHMFRGIRKLRKIKKEYKIDATISYITVYNFFNVISKYKDKVIISIRNHLSTKESSRKAFIMNKISSFFCDKIVCCSNSVAFDQLNNYHVSKKKVVVIENFCDTKGINKCMEEVDNENIICDNLIVTMARLVPHKGHKHIIKAMSLVVKKVPDAKLLIFSRGPLEEELKKMIHEYKLDKNIIFMGFHSNPYKFLKYAKAFILASDYEGFPNVIIEAMTCGVPIISTSSPGGVGEIIDDTKDYTNYVTKMKEAKFGILVPSFISEHDKNDITENEKELSKAILNLLTDKKKYEYYHKQSLVRVKKYNKNKIIKKWLGVIE